jgi:hypothetical protein
MAATGGLFAGLAGRRTELTHQRLFACQLALAIRAQAIQPGRSAEYGQAAHADRNHPARDETAWNHEVLKTFLSYGTFTGRATRKYS